VGRQKKSGLLPNGFHVRKKRKYKIKIDAIRMGINWYRYIFLLKSYFEHNFPANNRSDCSQNCQFYSRQNCSIQCKSVGGAGGGCRSPHRSNSFAALLLPNPRQHDYCLIHKFTYMLHRYAFSRVLFSSALGAQPIGGEGGCCVT
jgi:hypothetical protein